VDDFCAGFGAPPANSTNPDCEQLTNSCLQDPDCEFALVHAVEWGGGDGGEMTEGKTERIGVWFLFVDKIEYLPPGS
jgi:hypothetical protein